MRRFVILIALLSATAPAPPRAPARGAFVALEPGLELGSFLSPQRAAVGDSLIRVLRVDPRRFELRLLNASAPGQAGPRSARGWCERERLVAAINASMYQEDLRTSVSLMTTREHVNNAHVSRDQAVLAFDALEGSIHPVRILDRTCDDLDLWRTKYGTLVQSIRMISCRRENVWAPQPRRASTAAIGIDAAGRVLLIHARTPFTTHDLIDGLLELPLGLTRAMYLEGGPEAQLFVSSTGGEHEFLGGHDMLFDLDRDARQAWPVPNVIGVVRRAGGR